MSIALQYNMAAAQISTVTVPLAKNSIIEEVKQVILMSLRTHNNSTHQFVSLNQDNDSGTASTVRTAAESKMMPSNKPEIEMPNCDVTYFQSVDAVESIESALGREVILRWKRNVSTLCWNLSMHPSAVIFDDTTLQKLKTELQFNKIRTTESSKRVVSQVINGAIGQNENDSAVLNYVQIMLKYAYTLIEEYMGKPAGIVERRNYY